MSLPLKRAALQSQRKPNTLFNSYVITLLTPTTQAVKGEVAQYTTSAFNDHPLWTSASHPR